MGQGFGDRLARGGVKANFSTSASKISDKTWADAFKDFDPEEYAGKKKEGQDRKSK